HLFLALLLHRRLHLVSDAETVMDDLVSKNSGSFRAFLAQADYFKQIKDSKRAAKAIATAQKLAPDESEVIVAAVDLRLAESKSSDADLKEARSLLGKALELYPQNPRLYLLLAQLEERSQDRSHAITVLRQGLAMIPDNLDLLWPLADLLLT